MQRPDFDLEAWKPYVYVYAYPDGRIFYVGKGKGDRILAHEVEARNGVQSEKCDIIRGIWASGGEVAKIKVAFFDDELAALQYEAYLISSLGGLANISQGRKNIAGVLLGPGDTTRFGYSICHRREDGSEYWDAREMAGFCGYIAWQNFHKVIKRAMKVVVLTGGDASQHFTPTLKSVSVGKRGRRQIENYHLSRRAFSLVILNADSTNVVVRLGKLYMLEAAVIASDLGLENAAQAGATLKVDNVQDETIALAIHSVDETMRKAIEKTRNLKLEEDLPRAENIRKLVEAERRKERKRIKNKPSDEQDTLF